MKNQKAKEILEGNLFLYLATCDEEGKTWVSPLTFAYDDDCNIYFHSLLDSNHILNIKENPEVSFSICDSKQVINEIDGLQGRGMVGQIDDVELSKVHELFFSRLIPNPEFREKFATPVEMFKKEEFPFIRFFKMEITELYKKNLEIPIARRESIDLNEFKALFK